MQGLSTPEISISRHGGSCGGAMGYQRYQTQGSSTEWVEWSPAFQGLLGPSLGLKIKSTLFLNSPSLRVSGEDK